MKKETALKIILIISIAGMLFSGYLSYLELFQQICALGSSCSTKILSLPSCVYGFVMYLVVFVIAVLGLRKNVER